MGAGSATQRTSEAQLVLERFLPYRLSILSNTVSNTIARDYRDRFGLSIADWRVMAVLGRFGPLTAGEVGARTAMDKVTVSRATARLIARRLVARAADATDRRRTILQLTARGARAHRQIVPLARRRERELAAVLSERERRELDTLLAKLQRHASAIAAQADAT